MAKYFQKDFISFFKELASNNNKEWFDMNRERYLKSVKEPFEKYVNDVIGQAQKIDKELKAGPRDCIFRINRDIRFSKDKTPYKNASSALLGPNGRKSMGVPSFYLELGPENVSFYGGAYFLEPADLAKVRTYIAKNLKEFEALLKDKKFKTMFGEMQGEESSRVPKELKAAAEKQPLLLRKQFYFGAELKPSAALADDLIKQTIDHYKAAMPMITFLRKAIR